MGKKKNTGPLCYAPLVQKIKDMDTAIKDMKMKLDKLKNDFCENDSSESEGIEICPDEVGSELAMLEIMRNVFIDTVAEEEPEGDA